MQDYLLAKYLLLKRKRQFYILDSQSVKMIEVFPYLDLILTCVVRFNICRYQQREHKVGVTQRGMYHILRPVQKKQ